MSIIAVKKDENAVCAKECDCSISSVPELFRLLKSRRIDAENLVIVPDSESDADLAESVQQVVGFMVFIRKRSDILEQELENFNGSIFDCSDSHIERLVSEFIRMNSGGKYIRGTLVNLGYHLFSDGDMDYSNGLAMAYELLQTAILIHDDIIDHATLRRNKPTIPLSYLDSWNKANHDIGSQELTDTANAMALCAGDFGMYISSQLLAQSYAEDKNLAKVLIYFNNSIINTIKGELIDVILPFEEKYGLARNEDLYESIIKIYRLKTSWYTVTGPVCSGAMLAGADAADLRLLEEFAEKAGIAFQMKDDILGIFSEEAALGKNVGSDIVEFKQTLMYSYIKADAKNYGEFLKYYGRQLDDREMEEFRNLLRTSGALSYIENEMNRYFDEAAAALDEITCFPKEKKDLLYGLLIYLRHRSK